MSSGGDFGNPLRKFKLVFLGEQSGENNSSFASNSLRAGVLNRVKGMLSNRAREIPSLHRQLATSQAELAEIGRVKEMALRENRRLQDDLATTARENQVWIAKPCQWFDSIQKIRAGSATTRRG